MIGFFKPRRETRAGVAALRAATTTNDGVDVNGGDDGTRTHDPLVANQVLYQLSYVPERTSFTR